MAIDLVLDLEVVHFARESSEAVIPGIPNFFSFLRESNGTFMCG